MHKGLQITLLIALVFTATSCAIKVPTPLVLTPTFTSPKVHPERQTPLIKGKISGLPENYLSTYHVLTPTGAELIRGGHGGNGDWETVISDSPNMNYIVTAAADGFVSSPISYTIHSNGEKAYIVENGDVTEIEALHLDFKFVPAAPVTPDN